MAQTEDGLFSFLGQMDPRDLAAHLEKENPKIGGVLLANLPLVPRTKVLSHLSRDNQRNLLAAIREVRSLPPAAVAAVAKTMRERLAPPGKSVPSPGSRPAAGKGAAENVPGPPVPAQGRLPSRMNPYAKSAGSAHAARHDPVQGAKPGGTPMPWRPRVTDETPINAPKKPGQQPPVAGDPAKSPLLKLNLRELMGMARKALSSPPGGKTPAAKAKPPARGMEGVVPRGAIPVGGPARIVGAAPPNRPAPAGGGKRMDGMAILASIMREAAADVRHNLAGDDPDLYARLKKRMFVFDDLNFSSQDALAQIFTIVPAAEGALALRFAPPQLRDRALRAISPRRAELLRAEGGGAAGKSGLDAIEGAQKKVLEVALRLQAAGRILIDPRDPDLAS